MGVFGPGEDFFTVKGAMEALAASLGLTFTYERETETAWLHPGIAASVWCKGKRLGVFGKLSNEINAELKIAKDEKENQNIYLAELGLRSPVGLRGGRAALPAHQPLCAGQARPGPGVR